MIRTAKSFYGNLCYLCRSPENIKICSKCGIVPYCSKEHQRNDWDNHKTICKMIAEAKKSTTYSIGCTPEAFRKYRYALVETIQTQKKILYPSEKSMLLTPRLCEKCYSRDNLYDCKNCMLVSYCSQQHEENMQPYHNRVCEELRLASATDHILALGLVQEKHFFPNKISKKVKYLPKTSEKLVSMLLHVTPLKKSLKDYVNYVVMLDFYAPMATIIFGLEHANIIENRKLPREKLIIHIVSYGDHEAGLCWEDLFSFIFTWTVNLKTLEFVLVGPLLEYYPLPDEYMNTRVKIWFYPCCYKDVRSKLPKPDVVVSFNNLYQNAEFKAELEPYIADLTDWGVPLIVTEFNENFLITDIETIKKYTNVKVVLEPQLNPFASRRPVRAWYGDHVSVYYLNRFISVIQKVY